MISTFSAGPKHHSVMTTGRPGAAGAWATPPQLPGQQDRLWDYGPAGAADTAAEPPAPQDIPGTTGQPGAADADADSAEAAVPSEGLLAGWRRRRTMPEYTAACGRLDHAAFLERANASVRCTGLGVKLYMPT